MSNPFPAGLGKLSIDESKIYLVRRKADGKRYRIYHDGREECHQEDQDEAKEK